jgi:hypothetical protein
LKPGGFKLWVNFNLYSPTTTARTGGVPTMTVEVCASM